MCWCVRASGSCLWRRASRFSALHGLTACTLLRDSERWRVTGPQEDSGGFLDSWMARRGSGAVTFRASGRAAAGLWHQGGSAERQQQYWNRPADAGVPRAGGDRRLAPGRGGGTGRSARRRRRWCSRPGGRVVHRAGRFSSRREADLRQPLVVPPGHDGPASGVARGVVVAALGAGLRVASRPDAAIDGVVRLAAGQRLAGEQRA